MITDNEDLKTYSGIVDFGEITPGNLTNGKQDDFELFARAFLEEQGCEIIRDVARGADGGVDLVVVEPLKGVSSKVKLGITWLVSVKHKHHSGKSVSPTDELNILERVRSNNCDGFMGFYSTLPSTNLGKLKDTINEIYWKIYDWRSIEKELIKNYHIGSVFHTYFKESHTAYVKSLPPELLNREIERSMFDQVSEALAIMKINAYKKKVNWSKPHQISQLLNKLSRFSYINSLRIVYEVCKICDMILQTEESKPIPVNQSISQTVYYRITEFLRSDKVIIKGLNYEPIIHDIVYSSTRYVLYQSHCNPERLPAATILNLIKFVYQSA